MEQRRYTYFVADVHLGLDVADPDAREARLFSFLRSVDPASNEALNLLGDIFDFWYEYRDVVPKGYSRVFAALLDLMDAGVRVWFFQGNHDVWTYRYFEELGMHRLEQPAVVEIGGKVFCLGHGDGLGPVPEGYLILRKAFHSRVLQFLFSLLHPWIAFRFGKGWSRNNRLARREKYVFRGESEPLYRFAAEYSESRHIDFFIFGHYHAHADMPLPSGARLMVLDDWLDGSSYIYFDGISGSIGYCQNSEK